MAVIEHLSKQSHNGHHKVISMPKDHIDQNLPPKPPSMPHSIGFRFVRYFLLIILCVVSSMIGIIAFLGWHLGMEVTVDGQGKVEPLFRYKVKTQRSGLIQTVCVQHGQIVKQGDLVFTLENTDLATEQERIKKELAMNQSQREALSAELQRARSILEIEIARAQVEYETIQLQLQQTQKEYQIYHKYSPYRTDGSLRPALDTLMPIRLLQTRVQRAKINIERARRHLTALDNRKQEMKTLTQLYEKLQIDYQHITSHLKQTNIYASTSGTVLTRDLDKKIGDRVEAGESVVELAELDGWQARVLIQEIDIPKVKNGQVVRLYVNAFPHMEYKVFEGIVTDVPRKPEPITPNPIGMSISSDTGTQYPIKIKVIDPQVSDGEKQYSLAYGMGVEAKIVTERGPIVDLLWKKFLKSVGKIKTPEIYRLDTSSEYATN